MVVCTGYCDCCWCHQRHWVEFHVTDLWLHCQLINLNTCISLCSMFYCSILQMRMGSDVPRFCVLIRIMETFDQNPRIWSRATNPRYYWGSSFWSISLLSSNLKFKKRHILCMYAGVLSPFTRDSFRWPIVHTTTCCLFAFYISCLYFHTSDVSNCLARV